MERSQLTWEEVSQYEEVKGYGQQVWKHKGEYYLVTNEGGIAEQRVVYELPYDLFQLLEQGKRNLGEIAFKLRYDYWPPNISQEEANRVFWRQYPEVLKNNKNAQKLFTRKELEELLPKGSPILASSDSD
ncbi:TPA: hypothetical protein TUL06_000882 [Streptococcus equi subsp. zooepidemicus]|uniref:Uncharacterized protein n=1 Tax=Streptococcus equi subsp. zooepidemicus TaxID=40041 RepID=A0A7Z8ZXB5_STRSZ|nr:hypothetical protein [Streptococcus equi]KIS14071.1 hypothetical protein AT50_01547 [Streptococcus equi subsp. zooepidemicus Sz105]VED85117.1 Uncharacterised protein [Streptococcus equi subsp. equi]MCD3370564.1 hypothetical protein [Streptococcus equi subsp. zooepidemicus]MCD3373394.1 hypothetical protein [Streptococcus equi subsp. zooepidemicus]MCD3381577.1 hypothetical protein [Streptococcus equi subsp. zooepidemicus]